MICVKQLIIDGAGIASLEAVQCLASDAFDRSSPIKLTPSLAALQIWATLLLVAAVALTGVIGGLQMEWESWKTEHSRRYSDQWEDQQKYTIWKQNVDYIENHNKDAEKHGFLLKMNKFGDMVPYCHCMAVLGVALSLLIMAEYQGDWLWSSIYNLRSWP